MHETGTTGRADAQTRRRNRDHPAAIGIIGSTNGSANFMRCAMSASRSCAASASSSAAPPEAASRRCSAASIGSRTGSGQICRRRDRADRADLKRIDEVRREVGMVFQQFNLFPHLTVLENCMLAPMWVRCMPRKEAEAIARHYLARVRIPEQADKYPGSAFRRPAAARRHRAGALHAVRRSCCSTSRPRRSIRRWSRRCSTRMVALALDGMTMLVVSHEMGFARQVANRMVLMDAGQIVEINGPRRSFRIPSTSAPGCS